MIRRKGCAYVDRSNSIAHVLRGIDIDGEQLPNLVVQNIAQMVGHLHLVALELAGQNESAVRVDLRLVVGRVVVGDDALPRGCDLRSQMTSAKWWVTLR